MKYSASIKQVMFKTGLMKAARKISNPRRSVAILRYHAVARPENNFYASPSIGLAPDIFEEQIDYISKNYQVISLDQVANCIKTKTQFPENSVVITFDDGYKDNFTAFEILKRYGVTGTFYIAADCIDNHSVLWLFEVIYLLNHTSRKKIQINRGTKKDLLLGTETDRKKSIRDVIVLIKSNNLNFREEIRDSIRKQTDDVTDFSDVSKEVMLTWDQVKQMHSSGMTIGGHTMTHINLPNADPEDAWNEIANCKKLIEEQTGAPVYHFSYPNGGNYDYYNSKIINMVKKAGFRTASTSINGLTDLNTDLHELKRIRITSRMAEVVYQIDCEKLRR